MSGAEHLAGPSRGISEDQSPPSDGKARPHQYITEHLAGPSQDISEDSSGEDESPRSDGKISEGSSSEDESPRSDGKARPHQCRECGRRYTAKGSLRTHEKLHRGELEQCEVCGKSFTQKSSLRLHMKMHQGRFAHACDQCDKTFAVPSLLKAHKVVHTELECEVCGDRFRCNQSLTLHMKSHTGVNYKCFTCDICGKKLIGNKAHLKRHIDFKHTTQRIECPMCDRVYKNQHVLEQHLRKYHTNKASDDVYSCDLCSSEIFQTSEILRRHLFYDHLYGSFGADLLKTKWSSLFGPQVQTLIGSDWQGRVIYKNRKVHYWESLQAKLLPAE